jgi:hypothetical protein
MTQVALGTEATRASSSANQSASSYFFVVQARSGNHLYGSGHPIVRGGRWPPMNKRSTSNALMSHNEQNGHGRSLVRVVSSSLARYCVPVLLTIFTAVATGIAAVNHGPHRVYWSMAAFAAIAGNAVLNAFKEHRTASTHRSTDEVKAELATTLADIGLPLVAALGNVTSARSVNDATAAIDVLIECSVSLAQTQLGRQGADKCRVRAAYYEFDSSNKLVRKNPHAYAGAKLPRADFSAGRSDHDNEVLKFARGEDVRFVRDLGSEAPPYFADAAGRCYKSFISVPVRAGSKSFGLLTADSDKPYSLTSADVGFIILVAGTLAAGLAHTDGIRAMTKNP